MDDMQHAGEDDFPVKTLTGRCDTCGQDFYNHILEDFKGNKFACPVQSPTEVITPYLRGFEDGFARRGDGSDFKNLQNKLDECRSENVRLIRDMTWLKGIAQLVYDHMRKEAWEESNAYINGLPSPSCFDSPAYRDDFLTAELAAAKRVGEIALAGCAKHAERVELMLLMRCPACNSPRHQAYPETCQHKFHEAFDGERMPTAEDCSPAQRSSE